jgi:TP901 family phage tail tape measure protein
MSVRTDTINLNVNVNGNVAQNQLNDLRKKAGDVTAEMSKLKKGTDEYIAKKAELAKITGEMDTLRKQIGITALTQKELIAELNKLKALKGSVIPFSNEFKELDKQIKAVENRLYDVKNGVQGFASFFSKIKDEVKQFGVVALGYLGFQFLTSQFQNIIKGAGKLSDSLADIQRVTGLTAAETKILNEQLSGLDTRTSTEGLRNIAIIAGKLGVAKEDVLGFTKAVDKLVVALGDELGNADQITTTLGKILNVFDGKVNEDNITRLGNAFVQLANTGAASGGFIADFDQRLSGIAKSSGIGLGALSGLGAGLEELGAKVESSSTAVQKLIVSIAGDLPGAAKISGMSTQDFTKLFATDATEALLRYSEGLVKNKQSFAEVTASLQDAGEEGARTIETISKLGGSADQLRGRINLGKQALQETSAITAAFDLKNQTLGATLDKLGKDFNRLVTSSAVTNFLKGAIEGAAGLLQSLKNLPQWISENKASLTALIGVVLIYSAAKIRSAAAILLNANMVLWENIAFRAGYYWLVISETATKAYAFAKAVLTGQITLAAAAQRIWNFAISANPLGALLTVLTAVVTAVVFFTNKVKELSIAQKTQNDLQKRTIDLTVEEEAKATSLFKALKNTTLGLDSKKKLLAELIAINPEYLQGLTLENVKYTEGQKILDFYILKLREVAREKARNALIQEKEKEVIQAESENLTIRASNPDKNIKSGGAIVFKRFLIGGGIDDETKKLAENNNKIKTLNAELKVLYDGQVTAQNKLAIEQSKTAENAGKETLRTIKNIKESIQKLDEAYEAIDVKNISALKANRAERKKLQDELDALEGKDPKKTKSEKSQESEYAKLKKEAAQFAKDLQKLKKEVDVNDAEETDREVKRLENKYNELLAKALQYYKAHVNGEALFNAQRVTIEELFQAEVKKIRDKQEAERGVKEYEQALKFSDEFYDAEKAKLERSYAEGKISKGEYEDALTFLTRSENEQRVQIATDYANTVKKAADDVNKFTTAKEKQTTQDLRAETELRKKLTAAEEKARLELAVKTSRPGSDGRLQAQKNLLDYELKLKAAQLKEEYKIKEDAWKEGNALYDELAQERLDKEKELEKQNKQEIIDMVMGQVNNLQSALGSINTIISNRENKELANDRKLNDTKKKEYKKQLDSKLINQAQYQKKVDEIDEEQAKKERQIRYEQAKRERALAIFSAIVNTAAAVAEALPNVPLSIAVGLLGALQIGAIVTQPLPELGKGDWLTKGDKHSDPSGGIHILAERDEAVIAANAMTDPNVYSVTGTTAQITSALNSRGGGVDWANGALLQMPVWRTARPAAINSDMPRIMERGGVVRQLPGVDVLSGGSGDAKQGVNRSALSGNANADLLRELIEEQKQTREELKNWKGKIKGDWVIKDLDETRSKYDEAKRVSGLGQ